MYFAWTELNYALCGQTTTAQVQTTETVVTHDKHGNRTEQLAVRYSFAEPGGEPQTASDLLPGNWPQPGPKVEVQFVTGRRIHSRIAGPTEMIPVYFFFGSLAVLAGVIGKFFLEAKASERRPRRRYY